ncbi:MAG: hypothetical protein EOP52_09680 [Sphingobacteriales bacterium]|nr:MAG: hypothetical protein EOP52_09680 [Sphingobacteriales bacterium]
MNKFIISFLIVWLSINSYANDTLIENKKVKFHFYWSKNNQVNDTIIIEIEPLVDILLPDNSGCFNVDTNGVLTGTFRNMHCPFYILNQNTNSVYRSIVKDTVIKYEWIVPINMNIKKFVANIDYVVVNDKHYVYNKKIEVRKDGIVLINPEEEYEILSSISVSIDK